MRLGAAVARDRVSPCCGALIAAAVILYVTGKEDSMEMCADRVIYSGEGLRIMLAPLAHSNWGFLTGSCIGIAVIGPHLERCYGSAGFLCILLVSATVTDCLYLLLSCLMQAVALGNLGCVGGLAVLFQALIYLRTGYWEQLWPVSRFTVSSRCLPWLFLPLSGLLAGSILYAAIGLLVGFLLKARILTLLLPKYTDLEAFSRWRPVLLLQKYGLCLPIDARSEAHDCLSRIPSLSYSLAPAST
jgi:membrane associated rhomboid family serine protease